MSKITKAELIVQLTSDPIIAKALTNSTIKQLQEMIEDRRVQQKLALIETITTDERMQSELIDLSDDTLNLIVGLIAKPTSANGQTASVAGKNYSHLLIPHIRNNASKEEIELRAQLNKLAPGGECETTMGKALDGLLHFNAFSRVDYDPRTKVSTRQRGQLSTNGNVYLPAKLQIAYSGNLKRIKRIK